MDNSDYVSVKDACELLRCGRTKIYTHYINNELLQIKRKVGNKSFFLKSDIINLIEQEQQSANRPLFNDTTPQPLSAGKHPPTITTETKNCDDDTLFIHPDDNPEQELLVSEYISTLKKRITELENELHGTTEILNQYKSKLLNTIPLIEHSTKLKQKETALLEAKSTLEQLQTENNNLNQTVEQTEENFNRSQDKLNKTMQVALAFKTLFKESDQKEKRAKGLNDELQDVYRQLNNCGFFQWKKKETLKNRISLLLGELQKLR